MSERPDDQSGAQPDGNLLIYRAEEGAAPIRVLLEGQTVWLTQRQIAELYGTSVPNINQHITTIYEAEELPPEATVKKYLIVQTELPVLSGAGRISHKTAIDHANRQYDAFAERRRGKAEAEAEAGYVDELNASAKLLDVTRGQPANKAGRKSKRGKEET